MERMRVDVGDLVNAQGEARRRSQGQEEQGGAGAGYHGGKLLSV
jgi:hypothetical protein